MSRRVGLAMMLSVTGALTVILPGHPGRAAAEPGAGVVTSVRGESTATRVSVSAPVPLKVKDAVFVRDRIETREHSLARILLSGKALVTIRELSVFTISEEPDRAVVNLQGGRAALGVAKSLLKPGEAIEIRTPNAIAAVRGSTVVAEVAQGEGPVASTISTLEVSLPVLISVPGNGAIALTLASNQTVRLTGFGALAAHSPVRGLTPQEITALAKLAGSGGSPQHTEGLPEQAKNAQMQAAAEAAERASEFGLPSARPLASTGNLGLNENLCAGGACVLATPPVVPPGPPPVIPPVAAAPPVVPPPVVPPPVVPPPVVPPPVVPPPVIPPVAGPPPVVPPGPPPVVPPPVVPPGPPPVVPPGPPPVVPPPPPPPPGSAFLPPGQGGGPPNSTGNPTPGQGGVPPGQQGGPPGPVFTPPGHGGLPPGSGGNPNPGHGGTPPGQARR